MIEQFKQWAEQSGECITDGSGVFQFHEHELENFVRLATTAARREALEQAAKLCEEWKNDEVAQELCRLGAKWCEQSIRALIDQPQLDDTNVVDMPQSQVAPDHSEQPRNMVAQGELPEHEQFCFCNGEISLQMVSGGAAAEGLYGRLTLNIDGKYVSYVREADEPVWQEVSRLIATVKYIIGIAERGEGRVMREGEIAESFVLGYVKKLESALAQQGDDARDAMRHVMTIAHFGGLANLSEADALIAIRKLTLPHFDDSTNAVHVRAAIKAAALAGQKGE